MSQCDDCDRTQFILDFLYEALGPANDDIYQMAVEEWKAQRRD